MKYLTTIMLTAAMLLSASVCLNAQEPMTVDQIVEKANLVAYYGGNDGTARVHMIITDKQGRTRERDFTILRKDIQDGGEQKFYVYFNDPSDVRKMVYMVWKHIGNDDDRWLYLPALDLVRRIAASDRRSSFVGSHFVYEDVSGRSIEEDNHELIETTDEFYKIKNVPKEASSVEFSYYFVWIDRNNFIPVKAEYYNKQNNLYRRVQALKVEDIQGIPTVTKSQVTDIEAGGNTVSEFSNVKYDVGIDESIFTERYLRRPPREWIK